MTFVLLIDTDKYVFIALGLLRYGSNGPTKWAGFLQLRSATTAATADSEANLLASFKMLRAT